MDALKLEEVAPLVGAWIETHLRTAAEVQVCVAPLVGAWIETVFPLLAYHKICVAPLVGAWIETHIVSQPIMSATSRTPRGCVD